MSAIGAERRPRPADASPGSDPSEPENVRPRFTNDEIVVEAERASEVTQAIVEAVGQVILGKTEAVRLTLAAILAGGHVLLEDLPGMGKTTLANTFAQVLGLSYQRIQFTADLLPADVLGISVYNQTSARFDFHPGPIFANVILADEVNRATPKTQSALLEAMEEHQVTQDRTTRALPTPFVVIATQNPTSQVGTFPLPESQLDRFLIRLALGYPDGRAERALLQGDDRRGLIESCKVVTGPDQLMHLRALTRAVHTSDALLDYLQALLDYTRRSGEFSGGLSPRAGLALLNTARAWAILDARPFALPEDVQAVLGAVSGHRLRLRSDAAQHRGSSAEAVVERLLDQVPIP